MGPRGDEIKRDAREAFARKRYGGERLSRAVPAAKRFQVSVDQ